LGREVVLIDAGIIFGTGFAPFPTASQITFGGEPNKNDPCRKSLSLETMI